MTTVPSASHGPILEIRGLTKRFKDHEVLHDIDLDVAQGEVVAIIGPSGSGKSTLLRCVNLIEEPTEGSVSFDGATVFHDGHRLDRAQRQAQRAALLRMGMVFQQFNLFPHMTAIENVLEAPRSVLHQPKGEARHEALDLLNQVGLSDKAESRPGSLSGGQQQRVAIVRALAMRPSLMLFDEPTSALDPEMVGEVLEVIRIVAEAGMTMLIVTHEMAFARSVADRVVILDDGRIIEQGPPNQVLVSPTDDRSRQFLRRVLQPEERIDRD